MAQLTDEELLEAALANQIPEAPNNTENVVTEDSLPDYGDVSKDTQVNSVIEDPKPKSEAAQYLGQKLGHMPGESPYADKDSDKEMIANKKLSRIGEKIGENADIRDGNKKLVYN